MTETVESITLHPNVKNAMVNPTRYMEIRAWLKEDGSKKTALKWRGEDGESMMHWAFLSNWALASELLEVGLTFEETDKYGRTPMDWLNDRLWYSIVNKSTATQLSSGAKERLRRQSEEQINSLWSLGARPSFQNKALHPGVVWLRSGAFDLMYLLNSDYEEEKNVTFFGWPPHNCNALHAWILSPSVPKRREFLKNWCDQYDVDAGDNELKSPLWYAVEMWCLNKDYKKELMGTIKELIDMAANPFLKDLSETSPIMIVENSFKNGSIDQEQKDTILKVLTKKYKEDPNMYPEIDELHAQIIKEFLEDEKRTNNCENNQE